MRTWIVLAGGEGGGAVCLALRRSELNKIAGLRPEARGEGDRPGHLSGHGGPDPQPEHHAISRAGAQVPFSSINYGMDTSPEGRMVMRNVMLATEAGLGNGETPIFPIQIFRVKEGVNYNPGDPNYDLFQLAMPRSAPSGCSPTSPLWTRPSTCSTTKPGHPETEIAYMGCRTRVIGNVYDPTREICPGRGNLSFTSINLPRIAIKAKGDIDWFFEELERMMRSGARSAAGAVGDPAANKKVYNFPFLMGQGVWLDSEKLGWTDAVRRGAQARHPVHRLHRSGGSAEGPAR